MVFTRRFAAPVEQVWRAWTDPDQVVLWWGPKGFTNTNHAMDLRVGGVWHYTMHAPDGTDYINVVTYLDVKPPARLEYDHGDDKNPKWFHVTVDFTAEGAETKMVMRMKFPTPGDLENAKKYGIEGHHGTMGRLDAHLPGMASLEREIVLSRVFHAPRELVWEAMTNPKHVAAWWGPRGFTTETKEHDFRVGGAWTHVMRGPDGKEYPNKSIFREIVPLQRVVYTHGGGAEDKSKGGANFTAAWILEPSGVNGTRLTLRMTFPSVEARDRVVREYGAVEGGRQTLGRLAEYLPGMRG